MTDEPPPWTGAATFSPCGQFRYRLERRWGDGPRVAVIMVNPSAADANSNDPTIRRIVQFARREGWGEVTVVNLFALIAARIADVAKARDAVGPDNLYHLARAIDEAEHCVVAWGRLTKLPFPLRGDWRVVQRLALEAAKPLHCWGITKDGDPRHPLFLPRDTALRVWQPPEEASR